MAVLALALGIGANSNIFSFVNAYLLKPLPSVKDTGRLMLFQSRIRQNISGCSYLDFADFARQSRAFESISAGAWMNPILSGRGEPERLRGKQISAGYFDVFTVQPVLGRRFAAGETERVVLLSDGFWQRRFGGDPSAVGQAITLDDASYRIVGVMPPRFRSEWQDLDVWTPMSAEIERTGRRQRNLEVIARLRLGATRASAQAEVSTIAARLAAQFPDTNKDVSVALIDYVEALGNGPRESIQIMVGVALFVLLIACSNVANLQVARATGRVNEIAIRVAMGANRWRIIRQVIIESTVVALAGGVAGLALSQVGVKLLLAYLPAEYQPINKDFLDMRVVLFTAAVSLLTGIVSGLAPAFQVSRISVNEILKEGGRGMEAGSRSWLRNALVVVEMSLALVLLLASGLLMQSFVRMQTIDPGFRTGNLLAAYVALPDKKYPKPEQRVAFFRDVVEKAGAIPGVSEAAASSGIPLMGGGSAPYFVYEGQAVPSGGSELFARSRSVTANYLQAMGITLRRGRYFGDQDTETGMRVAIVNERFGARFFAGADPVGRRFKWGRDLAGPGQWITIVGVIGDVKSWNLTAAPPPEVFLPMRQAPANASWVLMRTAFTDPSTAAPAFRAVVRTVDRDQPINDLRSMEKVLHETMTIPRMMTTLMTLFAAIALAMAALGIYGVVAYSAAQRTREIGIRMALGAGGPSVIRLVLRQALWMVAIGVLVGIPAAAATTKVLGSYLYGVTARDPLTFFAVPAGLSLIALAASYLPARRATQVDPVVALRCE